MNMDCSFDMRLIPLSLGPYIKNDQIFLSLQCSFESLDGYMGHMLQRQTADSPGMDTPVQTSYYPVQSYAAKVDRGQVDLFLRIPHQKQGPIRRQNPPGESGKITAETQMIGPRDVGAAEGRIITEVHNDMAIILQLPEFLRG